MLNQTTTSLRESVELLGELHPLMSQLGSVDGLVTLSTASASLSLRAVHTPADLEDFLVAYRTQILLPLELPAICRACDHAGRNEGRELIALDQWLTAQPLMRELAAASRRVGRSQLERLAPLRDARVAQRYLQAVREGRAVGWHTVVFGLTLALYSLPVRQGLITYARQILSGFITSAARPLRLKRHHSQRLLENLCQDLPRQLEAIVVAVVPDPDSLKGG